MNRKLAFALVLSAIAIAGCKREAQPAPVAPAAAPAQEVASAVVSALQQTAIPVAPVDVASVKGDASIAPWPTAEQNANTVLNGVSF